MTTIAVRDGVMAADTMESIATEAGGSRKFLGCKKIYTGMGQIIGTSGDSTPGHIAATWLTTGSGAEPDFTVDDDFELLVLNENGLFTVDRYMVPIELNEPFYAVGSGTKAALGAMHMGATAAEAVKVASKIDPYTSARVVTRTLTTG